MVGVGLRMVRKGLWGGEMGRYVGVFKGRMCIGEMVGGGLGGSIVGVFRGEGMVGGEIKMVVRGGVMVIMGGGWVYLIKERKGERG